MKLVYGCDYSRVKMIDVDNDVDNDELFRTLERVYIYLRFDEVRIIKMMMLGHGPSHIARVCGYGVKKHSRQYGKRRMTRVVNIVKHYLKHLRLLDCLPYRFEGIDRDILTAILVDRSTYASVGKRMSKSRIWVVRCISRILADNPDYCDLVADHKRHKLSCAWRRT